MNRVPIITVLAPLLGVLMVACTSMQESEYDVITTKEVQGVSLQMVRPKVLTAGGQVSPDHQPDYGILDPSRRFHSCGQEECSEEDFQTAAANFASPSDDEEGPGGGGGGGSGGGGGM